MRQSKKFQGIFALPVIPFLDDGTIDKNSLINELEFCIKANVHGLAIPLESGEFYSLSEEERLDIAELTVKIVNKRVPVIIGVSSTSTTISLKYAKHAQNIGADGIISVPLYMVPDNFQGVLKHFRELAESVDLPIIYQNLSLPGGSTLSSEAILELCGEIENIKYVKEEANPPGHKISYLVKNGKEHIIGVFAGQGGKGIIEYLDRGASGVMPACHVCDVLVKIYESYNKGECEKARKIYNDLLPLLILDEDYLWLHNAKTILVKRGIIRTATLRAPRGITLDDINVKELEKAMDMLTPWFSV